MLHSISEIKSYFHRSSHALSEVMGAEQSRNLFVGLFFIKY